MPHILRLQRTIAKSWDRPNKNGYLCNSKEYQKIQLRDRIGLLERHSTLKAFSWSIFCIYLKGILNLFYRKVGYL